MAAPSMMSKHAVSRRQFARIQTSTEAKKTNRTYFNRPLGEPTCVVDFALPLQPKSL
jgi:hypothetical protein